MPLLGNVVISKKFIRTRKIMVMHSNEMGECVHVVRQICLKIPSNLLHMKLTLTQVHKYDFSNCYG